MLRKEKLTRSAITFTIPFTAFLSLTKVLISKAIVNEDIINTNEFII